jgi:hypothetical protein
VCGPHNVEEKEREKERQREREEGGKRERERERGKCLGEFTLQANIDLGQDLASLT